MIYGGMRIAVGITLANINSGQFLIKIPNAINVTKIRVVIPFNRRTATYLKRRIIHGITKIKIPLLTSFW